MRINYRKYIVFLAMFFCLLFISADTVTVQAEKNNEIVEFETKSPIIDSIYLDSKCSLNELVSKFPTTISVRFNEETEFKAVNVTWNVVGDDYEKSSWYYYEFLPEWGAEYELTNDIDYATEVPYIAVFVNSLEESKAKNVTSSSNERTEYYWGQTPM